MMLTVNILCIQARVSSKLGAEEDIMNGKLLNCGAGHATMSEACYLFLKIGEDAQSHILITPETSVSRLLFPSLRWVSWGKVLRYWPHVSNGSFTNGQVGLRG